MICRNPHFSFMIAAPRSSAPTDVSAISAARRSGISTRAGSMSVPPCFSLSAIISYCGTFILQGGLNMGDVFLLVLVCAMCAYTFRDDLFT